MENMFELLLAEQRKADLQRILRCNEKTGQYGLTLTEKDARELMACREDSLKESRRVEFGESILPAVIEVFLRFGLHPSGPVCGGTRPAAGTILHV